VLAQPNAQGEHIRITGQVFDGAGNAVMDAMVEIAQPDGSGKPIVSVATPKQEASPASAAAAPAPCRKAITNFSP
jgi:protocatechuate 3,4-dioxygenase beta subunit